MARSINRLTARAVSTLKVPGRHADGGGLYLQVDPSLAKRWVFVFQWRGQRKEMGLGSTLAVGLAEAREAAQAARASVRGGVNPIEARKAEQVGKTFGDVADDVLAGILPSLSNMKHQNQWKRATPRAPKSRPRMKAMTGLLRSLSGSRFLMASAPCLAKCAA